MFSTFTGNSRRPRNVNLAGGPRVGWGASSGQGGSGSSASRAQAERQQRQRDRRRNDAAKLIQRTWRGHRVQSTVFVSLRAEFDRLFANGASNPVLHESTLPLLELFFNKSKDEDIARLMLWIANSGPPVERWGAYRLQKLGIVVLEALEVEVSTSLRLDRSIGLLRVLIQLIDTRPQFLNTRHERYYKLLARLCKATDSALERETVKAILCPLTTPNDDGFVSQAYDNFALHLLSEADVPALENNLRHLSRYISTDYIFNTIHRLYTASDILATEKEPLFNVIAHFIGLTQTVDSAHDRLLVSETLFELLSPLSHDIRARLSPSSDGNSHQPFRPYVERALLSLCDRDSISKVFADFSRSTPSATDIGPLTGYIFALLRSFPPQQGDAIRMHFYLQDIPDSSLTVLTYLWQVVRQGCVYKAGLEGSRAAMRALLDYFGRSGAVNKSALEADWRVVLLFLDIYSFVLRLSDDEDFVYSLDADNDIVQDLAPTRLRLCNLSRKDIADLSLMLKQISFVLHYPAKEFATSQEKVESSFEVGNPGFIGLRDTFTAALRLLYERDSRLHFFGPSHWLLEGFSIQDLVAEAVAEEQRRQRVEEGEAQEEEPESSDDDDSGSGGMYSNQVVTSQVTADIIRRARIERGRARVMPPASVSLYPRPELGPTLAILRNIPFGIPFETRVEIFRRFVNVDRIRRRDGMDPDMWRLRAMSTGSSTKHFATIRRGHIFEDAFKQFWSLGDGIKEPISISFRDQFDNDEAGIDGGGVTKEFLTSLIEEAFSPDHRMFVASKEGLLYPNPNVIDERRYGGETEPAVSQILDNFEFLGRIVGKCMYEGILIDVAFAPFFFLKWTATGETAYKGDINDLREMDGDLYRGLLKIKNHTGDVSDWGLTFTVDDQVSAPGKPVSTITRLLRPNGDKIAVNNDNRLLYMWYLARHRLVSQPRIQTEAFLRGIRAVVHPSWLSMFNQAELSRLVGGDSRDIDVEDLRRNTQYSGVYVIGNDGLEHPTIIDFWAVLDEMTDAERRDLLRYVTSTPRAPLLGFASLNPPFTIRDSGRDVTRLPSASTCVNLLKLPIYRDRETLKKKLVFAISSGAGFELS